MTPNHMEQDFVNLRTDINNGDVICDCLLVIICLLFLLSFHETRLQ